MRTLLTVTAALAIASSAGIAMTANSSDAQAQSGRRGGMQVRVDRMSMTYVAKAGASDLYEINSSRLAMEHARRPEVREFARMLVADHSRTSEQVMAAAREAGMTLPPPMMEPHQRQMIRQLERARGPGFDRLYANQQVTAHQQALTLHRNYARSGRVEPLRRVGTSAVPVIQAHLQHARRLTR
jgi:putative membrane protein